MASISKKDIRLRYFGYEGTSVRAIPKNVEKFDCPEYHNHVVSLLEGIMVIGLDTQFLIEQLLGYT